MDGRDERFTEPRYTVRRAAWFVRVPDHTLANWVRGYGTSEPLVTSLPSPRRKEPEIPFIGLAEALVAATLRRKHVSMQRIRKAIAQVKRDIGLEYALASRRLYTAGADLLYDYAEEDAEFRELAEVLKQQYVFESIVEGNLQVVTFGSDGFANHLTLPFAADRPIVTVDPDRAFGQPVFIHGGGRLQDVLTRFRGGEPLEDVARDFEVPIEDVLDILRAFVPETTTA